MSCIIVRVRTDSCSLCLSRGMFVARVCMIIRVWHLVLVELSACFLCIISYIYNLIPGSDI